VYAGRTIAFGLPGKYIKRNAKPFSEDCIDGKVVFQKVPKKMSRVRLYKCAMSNYNFENNFQLKDFYLTSSSSLTKVYILKDLYDTGPLHIGEVPDVQLHDGRLVPWNAYREIEGPARVDGSNSSSDEEADDEEFSDPNDLGGYEYSIVKTEAGVYDANDDLILVQLYALIKGVKLQLPVIQRSPSPPRDKEKKSWSGTISRWVTPKVKV
jgi:hypothetical protein